jgi:hypothetical protein
MNTIQEAVTAAVQKVAGPAWVARWNRTHVEVRGDAKFNRGKSVRVEFDDAERCEGAALVGSAGGLGGGIVLAAIAATDPEHARSLINGFEDAAEREELLFQVFGEK